MTNGEVIELHNPADMPDVVKIAKIEEPWIQATIFVPDEHLGAVLKLCEDRRGRQIELTYAGSRAPWWCTVCRSTKWCSISTTG